MSESSIILKVISKYGEGSSEPYLCQAAGQTLLPQYFSNYQVLLLHTTIYKENRSSIYFPQ